MRHAPRGSHPSRRRKAARGRCVLRLSGPLLSHFSGTYRVLVILDRSTPSSNGSAVALQSQLIQSNKSGRQDSNLRHPAPKAGALARLSYAPPDERAVTPLVCFF